MSRLMLVSLWLNAVSAGLATQVILLSIVPALLAESIAVGTIAIVASVLGLGMCVWLTSLVWKRNYFRLFNKIGALNVQLPTSTLLVTGIFIILSTGLDLAPPIQTILQPFNQAQIIRNCALAALVVGVYSSISQALLIMSLVDERSPTGEEATFTGEAATRNALPHVDNSEKIPGTQPSAFDPDTGRKRSGSDTMQVVRSSFSHIVRPISSKTRLISQQKTPRGPSLDSGTGEREIVEDDFDSWDTSAVDPQSWQSVMASSSSSPNQGRALETIPASPTTSRSPSPGHPLDLPPIPRRTRSRSHSPAVSYKEKSQRRLAATPISPIESHIHPLFRSDSPTPPPSITPGTVVTAAPGAGQLISDRRSLRRMRSGSLPGSPSPLVHSNSMDDMAWEARQEVESRSESQTEEAATPPEREMTPPIPAWVLEAGQRGNATTSAKRSLLLVPLGNKHEKS